MRQVPLGLGWAMSVHKSQGLTLDRAEVSLERAFEPGMACVSLAPKHAHCWPVSWKCRLWNNLRMARCSPC